MNYRADGFRAFYHHYAIYAVTDEMAPLLAGYPGAEEAEVVLTYGYIDHEEGMSLLILACGRRGDEGLILFDGNPEAAAYLRIAAVREMETVSYDEHADEFANRYAAMLGILDDYRVSEDVEKTRRMRFLDGLRHEDCIDDVNVAVMKDGLAPEACWVRIEGLGDHRFEGTLLNEPEQLVGCHESDQISFALEPIGEAMYAIARFGEVQSYTADELADGKKLLAAIRAYQDGPTQGGLLAVLTILRDSTLLIPCDTITSEADDQALLDLLMKHKDDPDALVGLEHTNKDEIRLVSRKMESPDDRRWLPIVTDASALGEDSARFSFVQKKMTDIMTMAGRDKDLSGLILNPLSESFVIEKEVFPMIEGAPSGLREE